MFTNSQRSAGPRTAACQPACRRPAARHRSCSRRLCQRRRQCGPTDHNQQWHAQHKQCVWDHTAQFQGLHRLTSPHQPPTCEDTTRLDGRRRHTPGSKPGTVQQSLASKHPRSLELLLLLPLLLPCAPNTKCIPWFPQHCCPTTANQLRHQTPHLVGNCADGLGHAHHQLAQLGIGGGLHQELGQAVAELQLQVHTTHVTRSAGSAGACTP